MLGREPVATGRRMHEFSQEKPEDYWEVEALFDLCFAPGREALSSYRLRDGVAPVAALCQVARDAGGVLAGAVRFWPVLVGKSEALLLGPIAVHPTRQGEGLAGSLIAGSVARAWDLGWSRVLLVGDLPFYQRYGFERLTGVEMPPPPNPERVLGLGDWAALTGPVTAWEGR